MAMGDLRLTSTWTGTGFSASPATGPASGVATPADLDGDWSGELDGDTPLPLGEAILGACRGNWYEKRICFPPGGGSLAAAR